eukprot:3644159-Amphidinium_carterae.1
MAVDGFTVVGPGGRSKRRAQSPLLDSQRATMYRALSPSAENNADMDVATPRGTGGLSPPPAVRSTAESSTGLVRPPAVPQS